MREAAHRVIHADPATTLRERGYIFLERSAGIRSWDLAVAICVSYSTVFLPLALVFEQARWEGHQVLNMMIDTALIVDVIVRFRTSFIDRGYEVVNPVMIAWHYLHTWLAFDVLSSIPFSALPVSSTTLRTDVYASSVEIQPHEWLCLLRILALGRCARATRWLFSTRFIRQHSLLAVALKVACLLYTYCIIAHYLGLGWYMIAVRPLEAELAFDDAHSWLWLDPPPHNFSVGYVTAVRYTCSVYWALSVMSNLKGHPAHETRQCLWHDPLVVDPLAERIYTILTFILGASFFSFIYGNIAQFVKNYYKSGVLHEQRLADADAIAHFYRITPELQARLRRHVDFTWSVTQGIDLDHMAGGLPRHLKLEVQLQVNLPMLRKVSFLQGLDEGVMEELVAKLVLLPVVRHEFVFYEGQSANRMFFINRGIVHVINTSIDEGMPLAKLREGDYFGELALLVGAPRTTDVVAATDVLLQALSVEDFKSVMAGHPAAKAQIEAVAEERRRQLGQTRPVKDETLGKAAKFARKWKQQVSEKETGRRRRTSVEPNMQRAAPEQALNGQTISDLIRASLRAAPEVVQAGGRRLSRCTFGSTGLVPALANSRLPGDPTERPGRKCSVSTFLDSAAGVGDSSVQAHRGPVQPPSAPAASATDVNALERKVDALASTLEAFIAAQMRGSWVATSPSSHTLEPRSQQTGTDMTC